MPVTKLEAIDAMEKAKEFILFTADEEHMRAYPDCSNETAARFFCLFMTMIVTHHREKITTKKEE